MKSLTGKSVTIKLSSDTFTSPVKFLFGEILINESVTPKEYNMITRDAEGVKREDGTLAFRIDLRRLNVSRISFIRKIELKILKKLFKNASNP